MMHRTLRILIGTVEICRQIYDFANGLKALGHHVETAIIHKNSFNMELNYDYDWRYYLSAIQGKATPSQISLEIPKDIDRVLDFYDIYIFQFGGSLLPANLDFPILRKRNKVILSVFNGNDIRHWSAAAPDFERFGSQLTDYYKNTSQPSNFHLSEFLTDSPYPNRLSEKLHRLRMAEKYANVIFSIPSQSSLALRPYMHFFAAFNLSLYPDFNVPMRDIPLVVHAPSNKGVKGTGKILAAVTKLKNEEIPFEFLVIENMANKEVREILLRADILIDQLDAVTSGMLALEGMATGCAVLGGNNSKFIPIPKNRPVLHITSKNIYFQLKKILTNKNLRIELAKQGRSFVEKHHDHRQVGQYLLDCTNKELGSSYHYYPDFFSTQYQLPSEEKIPGYLKVMTSQIIREWGLPPNIHPQDLVERGLVASEYLPLTPLIPRWNSDSLKPGI